MTENGRARMNLGMHQYRFVVPDLEGAIRWYAEKLDFDQVERRFGFPEVGMEIAHLVNDGGIRIELIVSPTKRSCASTSSGQLPAFATCQSAILRWTLKWV